MSIPNANARMGILLMLGGMLLFSLNDVLGKWLVGQFSVGQVMLIRSLAALAVLAPIVARAGPRKLATVEGPWLHVLRAVLLAVEGFAFYAAVAYLPLADTVTYWLAAPVYVAAVAPIALGERVGWREWVAILAGFAGVVIALDPSANSFSAPALIALGGSVAFSAAMILGRKLRQASDAVMVTWQMIAAVLAGGLGIWVQSNGWTPMSLGEFAQLALLGIVAMVAHVMMNRSFKHAKAATVMPFQYSLLVWAILFGWIFFGDVPRPAMLIGAALIVAAGLAIAVIQSPKPGRD